MVPFTGICVPPDFPPTLHGGRGQALRGTWALPSLLKVAEGDGAVFSWAEAQALALALALPLASGMGCRNLSP